MKVLPIFGEDHPVDDLGLGHQFANLLYGNVKMEAVI